MARSPTPKKQETHDRIVRTAAAAIRRRGFDGISVAEIMDEAGLTHGGFYAHFPNRDAMLAEALDEGASESLDRLSKASDGKDPKDALDAVVSSYLSDRHLTAPDRGCTLAALGSETSRQTPEVRQVATRRVRELADLLERQMPGWGEPGRHEDSLAAMSAMVGAMVIARAVDDPALGKAVRAAAAKLVHDGVSAKRTKKT